MDQIKEAFDKVKQDINFLKLEFKDLKKELFEIQNSILFLIQNQEKLTKNQENQASTLKQINSTQNQQIKTENQFLTNTSTQILPFKSLKPLNFNISTGNQGVSTDRQTNQQTDNSTHNYLKNNQFKQNQQKNNFFQESQQIQPQNINFNNSKITQQTPPIQSNSLIQPQNIILSQNNKNIQDPYLILEQLDSLKKELRFKIKRLTNQEMLVLSTIYQYEDQGKLVDYSTLSQVLNLSESSIRDYVTRIILKKIPIIKEKVNNKRIILHISPNLKKLASLNTLISLRDI